MHDNNQSQQALDKLLEIVLRTYPILTGNSRECTVCQGTDGGQGEAFGYNRILRWTRSSVRFTLLKGVDEPLPRGLEATVGWFHYPLHLPLNILSCFNVHTLCSLHAHPRRSFLTP